MVDVTIRPATATDAAGYNAYRRQIADEPNNGITYSFGEYTRAVEEDRQRILSAIADDTWHILVAVVDDEIVGHCSCSGATRLALRHIVGLGIDVAREYRNRGVGSALMSAMMDWARTNPLIRRVELDVMTHNLPAIHLYLKYGFEVEGRRKRAYFKDGCFVDAYVMALLFDD